MRVPFTLKSVLAASTMVAGLATAAANAAPLKTDFVFIIDATSSMAGEIAGVRNGFASFVGSLSAATVDARFAVIVYGGRPEITLDFTSDGTAAQTALNNIVIGSNAFQNNHNLNPEAGLEAIRMVLGAAPDSVMDHNHSPNDTGLLTFRSDARKNLILVTDEDSDRPFDVDNRFAGQTTEDPPTPDTVAFAGWQAEIDATADAVIAAKAFLNMLIGTNGDSEGQYGDFSKDVADADLLNFDPDATLAALLADALTNDSLQAQVLAADLVARTFDVAGANDADFVDNFFAAKLQEVIDDDGPDDPSTGVPEPATLALLGAGLFGLAMARRRKTA